MEKKISDLRIAIKIGHLVETVESIFGDHNSFGSTGTFKCITKRYITVLPSRLSSNQRVVFSLWQHNNFLFIQQSISKECW